MNKNKLIKRIFVFVLIAVISFLLIDKIYSGEKEKAPVEVHEREVSSIDYYDLVERNRGVKTPEVDGEAVYSIYVKDGQEDILFSRNKNEKLPIASLTKLMTALVIYENYDLNQKIGISDIFTDSHLNDLRIFSSTTFEELLYPLLIESNNSGAYAAAIAPEEISFDDFVGFMNTEAEEIGMKQTKYYNPSGLENGYGTNISTAEDLSKLIKKMLKIPIFWDILGKDHYNLSSKDGSVSYRVDTTNKFLNGSYFKGEKPEWHSRIVGGKTGFTYGAGGCLMIVLEDEEKEGYIINIILGADGVTERFEEMEKLINWLEEAYIFNKN